MLAGSRHGRGSALGRLGQDDWSWIQAAGVRHGLQPLLHHNANHFGAEWSVPVWLRNQWREAHFQATARALNRQMTMRRVAHVLESNDIAYAGLKGIWLAWHVFPNPATRPMCDIDVLVSRADARRAYAVLLEAGFVGKPLGSAAEDRALNGGSRHLPPLFLPQTTTLVEVHFGLTGKAVPTADPDAFENDVRLLSRRIWRKVGDTRLSYLDPTDCLLHLIAHGIYDNRLDSGPQSLCDIAALTQAHAIDWPLFWNMAQHSGYSQGAKLLLALAEHALGTAALGGPDNDSARPPDAILATALSYILDGSEVDNTKLHLIEEIRGSASWGHWLKRNTHRFFPDRDRLAEFGNISPLDRAAWRKAYRLYPAWLGRHLARLARTLWSRAGQARRQDRAALNAWLDEVGTVP